MTNSESEILEDVLRTIVDNKTLDTEALLKLAKAILENFNDTPENYKVNFGRVEVTGCLERAQVNYRLNRLGIELNYLLKVRNGNLEELLETITDSFLQITGDALDTNETPSVYEQMASVPRMKGFAAGHVGAFKVFGDCELPKNIFWDESKAKLGGIIRDEPEAAASLSKQPSSSKQVAT